MGTGKWHAGRRSLCIIDEFGKGTLAADGIGLLCATLHHFTAQRPSPRVIAVTHFSEVLNEANLSRSASSFTVLTRVPRFQTVVQLLWQDDLMSASKFLMDVMLGADSDDQSQTSDQP